MPVWIWRLHFQSTFSLSLSLSFSFFFSRETKFTVYEQSMHYSCIVYALFTHLKILKISSTILFTHLKIILLQYFQFLVFSFSNNKYNLNRHIYIYIYIYISREGRPGTIALRCAAPWSYIQNTKTILIILFYKLFTNILTSRARSVVSDG